MIGAVQVYVVPAGTPAPDGATENAWPLQIVAVWLLMAGVGLITTLMGVLGPSQFCAVCWLT